MEKLKLKWKPYKQENTELKYETYNSKKTERECGKNLKKEILKSSITENSFLVFVYQALVNI